MVAVMSGASSGRYMELNGGNLKPQFVGVNSRLKMKYRCYSMGCARLVALPAPRNISMLHGLIPPRVKRTMVMVLRTRISDALKQAMKDKAADRLSSRARY